MTTDIDVLVAAISAVLGGTFGIVSTRVSGRNDARRERYAEGLRWADQLRVARKSDEEPGQAANAEGAKPASEVPPKRTVVAEAAWRKANELRTWMRLDSSAVETAYGDLLFDADRPTVRDDTFESAREEYAKRARAFTRWTLGRAKLSLQDSNARRRNARTKRLSMALHNASRELARAHEEDRAREVEKIRRAVAGL